MSLSSLQLEAFLAVCEARGFTAAAQVLNITQSALSQRIKNLEEELGTSLFVREPSGIRVTAFGESLLRHAKMQQSLEREFLATLARANDAELRGIFRVAGHSSIMNSAVIPSLAHFVDRNPAVELHFTTAELHELPSLLSSGGADVVIVAEAIRKEGVENLLLGNEKNVVVERKRAPGRSEVFLDHDEKDTTTLAFFEKQNRTLPKNFRRAYFDDIESILIGVECGYGRAVAPAHLIRDRRGLTVVPGFKALKTPVHLARFAQPYYSRLHIEVTAQIRSGVAAALEV